jgi:hypothetical protein
LEREADDLIRIKEQCFWEGCDDSLGQIRKNWQRTACVSKELRTGTCNILILHRRGAVRNLEKVVQEYNLCVTALQEIRWTGQGILEERNSDICYSCQKSKHEFGCRFIVRKRSQGPIPVAARSKA